jgi:chemotaxis protein histidine kinase CheA
MRAFLSLLLVLWLAAPAGASKREMDDLRRQIETQRSGVGDLERLDSSHVATEELTLLKAWLDEASTQLTKEELDKTREVVDRCLAQAELIRQKTSAGRLSAQATDRETALKRSRDKVQKTKEAIQIATVNKKALEMTSK